MNERIRTSRGKSASQTKRATGACSHYHNPPKDSYLNVSIGSSNADRAVLGKETVFRGDCFLCREKVRGGRKVETMGASRGDTVGTKKVRERKEMEELGGARGWRFQEWGNPVMGARRWRGLERCSHTSKARATVNEESVSREGVKGEIAAIASTRTASTD